ncbi:DNA/RNA polymerase, partial [Coccomyxa subellipsoidea C-169]
MEDFREYMRLKNEKLHEQFLEQQKAAQGDRGGIFSGVCIFVNGFTKPSHLELKQIMASHGGIFRNYLQKDVTHIICSNLPDSKVKHLENVKERDPKPILLPEWVTDSLEAGQLLPSSEPAADLPPGSLHSLIAAQARQRCDMLKGPPRSSREDPAFQANYFAASRLHFIGSWKARIEALAASMANNSPKACPPARGSSRAIIHIDMDCFFACVAALGEPALQGKALCVSHSASSKGAGEVSSANYEARAFGVRAGMFISEAKRLCPDIIAFMDVTGLGDPEAIAGKLRAQIEADTGCTASAGIGPNMLLARLATKRAKPNGQFLINSVQVDLPGVGWSMREKLKALGITSVADVRNSRLTMLQHELGTKSGTLVWDYAHGRDDRVVAPSQVRKSVGAEINYAVRLDSVGDADKFVDELAGELADRMLKAGVKGRTLTLKVKRKKSGAPEPIKFLGHGICDNHSRSVTMPRFVGTRTVLAKTGKELLRAMNIPAPDIRGLGLTMTKLDNDTASSVARPSAPAPAKGALPAQSLYDPNAHNPF